MMERYTRVDSVLFGETSLPLPVSARLWRRAQPANLGSDSDRFLTSVQIAPVEHAVELRFRGTAVAETLSPGQQATLRFVVRPTRGGQNPRQITLTGAVLVGVEIHYEQSSTAAATLQFVAEASAGDVSPLSAEDLT